MSDGGGGGLPGEVYTAFILQYAVPFLARAEITQHKHTLKS